MTAADPTGDASPNPELVETTQPTKPEVRGPAEIVPNVLIDKFKEKHRRRGVLIPLKTTQEVRQDHTITHAFITRAPTKQANEVITALRNMRPDDSANPLPHLRRCAKPADLPAHLKTQFMNDTAIGRQIHTAKSTWIYIIVGEVKDLTREELGAVLSGSHVVLPILAYGLSEEQPAWSTP
ncbi:hypothetical protein NM208_g3625 [Fusarium decemcellulare]|uniref:Uncharacterized protein n=1 Tax=Fusarium decemcellulare TaxID=57161 RepID=A0ACC1SNJ1_9HYPO|nr:hypothetical protein NM208_g3625 [Fusarium decemcellulare]